MAQFNYDDIERARNILGLEKEVTILEVKERYYELSKQFHPDQCVENKKQAEAKFKEVTWAYTTLNEYISAYRVSFNREDVKKMSVDAMTYRHLKQFYDDWWGKIDM
ncbi:MAG: J domain-containing protein [Candidatus Omnitrophica bacterium]|nr:J domain-containing protein [Candidatus Omnitrophota bacterium]